MVPAGYNYKNHKNNSSLSSSSSSSHKIKPHAKINLIVTRILLLFCTEAMIFPMSLVSLEVIKIHISVSLRLSSPILKSTDRILNNLKLSPMKDTEHDLLPDGWSTDWRYI